jgi:hypothetical protein
MVVREVRLPLVVNRRFNRLLLSGGGGAIAVLSEGQVARLPLAVNQRFNRFLDEWERRDRCLGWREKRDNYHYLC